MTDTFAQTRRMQQLVAELWRLEGPRVENHVGDVAWQRFQHAGREGEWRIRLWEEDGEPVAWAWVRRPPMLQHEIHPRHRGGALHEELITWFEGQVKEDELRTSSLSTDTERLEFLRSRGYEIDRDARDFIYHACALEGTTEPEVPAGYRLRTVEPGDLERRVDAASDRLGALARHSRELRQRPGRLALPARPRLRRGSAGRILRGVLQCLARP